MKKLVIAGGVLGLLVISALFSPLFFINYKALPQKFFEDIKINVDVKNIGELRFKNWPFPALQIASIRQEGSYELENVELRFSFLSLLKFKPQISSVKLANAKIYLAGIDTLGFSNHDKFISNLIVRQAIKIDVQIDNLELLDKAGHRLVDLKSFDYKAAGRQNRALRGMVADIGEVSGAVSEDKDRIDVQISIKHPDYQLEIAEIYKNSELLSGRATININNPVNFVDFLLPDISFTTDKTDLTGPINIKFNIASKEDSMHLHDFNVASRLFKIIGEIDVARSNNLPGLINLNIDTFDLTPFDKIHNIQVQQNRSAPIDLQAYFLNNLIDTNIVLDKATINGRELLNNLHFFSSSKDRKLYIRDFSGQFTAGGDFALSGVLSENDFRSMFDGKFSLRHKDLNVILSSLGFGNQATSKAAPITLSADLKLTPIDFYLQNILLKMDDISVTGNTATKIIGNKPRVSAMLNFSKLDFDNPDYPILSPLAAFVKSLTQNMQDNEYLNKFIPIRTISYLGNFDLTFNNPAFSGITLDKVNLLMNVLPGQINIENLYINKGQDYISTSGNLTASDIKPKFYLKIDEGSWHVDFLYPKALLDIRNKLLSSFSLDKIALNLDCASLKLYQNDLAISDIKFSGVNEGILFNISNFGAGLLGGNLTAEGSILLDPYTWNFVYALNSIDLGSLSNVLPEGFFDSAGVASMNGMFTTNGDSNETLLYNLYTKSTLLAKDTKINKFSIDALIENINDPKYNSDNFAGDVKNGLLTGQTNVNSFKSDVELSNGVLKLGNIEFTTKYTKDTANATINIYDNFSLNLDSVFTTELINNFQWVGSKETTKIKIPLKASGSFFTPQKNIDTEELKRYIDNRKQPERGRY